MSQPVPAFHRYNLKLTCPPPPVRWPTGFKLRSIDPIADSLRVHDLLVEGFARGGGSVQDYPAWLAALTADPEYDAKLIFLVSGPAGGLTGVALCWTSAFVKDLVVKPTHRRRGLATCLLQNAFGQFQLRGAKMVSLKVEAGNHAAIALYRSLGMREG